MSGRYRTSLPDIRYWADRVPCQMACPVFTDAGRYVQLVAEGSYRASYLTARSPNPLASVCGRVCSAPCEDSCRRGKFDAPVGIRALKRFVAERYGVESRDPDTLEALRRGELEPGNKWRGHLARLEAAAAGAGRRARVAVVGAGPAGLACAHDLAFLGHEVVVFEASRRAGGMAFHGIPDFRLPPSLLDKEVLAIEALGVEMRYETPLTREQGLAALKAEGFEAVFLAVGAQRGRLLQCPGSDLDGIIRAIDYLININNGYRVPQAKQVLVVGGGFVAFDAARMALRALQAETTAEEAGGGMAPALDAARLAARAGAEVTLASLESFDEMPVTRTEQGREEYAEALAEGIRFLPQRNVARFEGDGKVSRVHLIGVRRTYDDEGRFAPEFDENISEQLEADLVILAIGQQPDLAFLAPEDGVETSPAGTISVDPETLATTAAGIFAGGDAAFGPRNLIDAVANGKRAARSIQEFLGREAAASHFLLRFEKIPTRQFDRTADYDRIPRESPPTTDLGRRTGISEVETAYDEASARVQAERCLACHLQTIYDPQKCVLCNRCVDICPENCLKLVPLEDVDLAPEQIDAAREGAGVASDERASAMLKDDERCIRCGLCAVRCPTDAMTMELLYYEERTGA
ncbi:MAG: FAD-dependent oxidoreductase [Planctomycetota bacterium]|jgi:NADPH-dependent glutamate synthase beta subunit-like oxidoreductase